MDGLYKDVTFEEMPDDSTLKIYMRMDLLWRACLLGHIDCIHDSLLEFRNWQHAINPDKINS